MPSSLALNATVCDCTKPLHMGILQFSDEDCRPEEDHSSSLTVKYSVYTERRAKAKFPGQLCARWKIQKHISVDFFGLVVIVTDKVALDTSFTECQIMYESHRCNDQLMVLKENKYVFDEEPSESGYWLQTIITEKTLAHSFRYDEVKYFDYAHQSNPAYSDTIIDHMNIMADIAAAMNEHSAGNYSPAHIPSTATVLGTVADAAAKTSWLDQLTNFLYIGAVIIIAVVSIRVCIACGCCGLIWKFCSLLRIPTRTASNRDDDIELGITGRNPTVRGMM
ncbi:hypothetical protein DAPPUDRAFT_105644 [Daphnia pulex]|uniref:Uncharacterized protein n=1 Tax=Daphnia pulex TaxID=6669 RepID=E9GRC7_DAPPU|nr:hypothetical protein DAPPUDRAFT_105644 [Daphnia pulex]|eukprot:EFX78021.1 hypothetical protein DAPPUDRAFT_105644 [Daphnia pulex]